MFYLKKRRKQMIALCLSAALSVGSLTAYAVWFIGGAILTATGIIGEYVGKIYKEVKRRPRYFIE